MSDEEVTVDEAAKMLGISPAMARHRMDSGRLAYREKEGVRVARREDVLALVPDEEKRRAFAKAIGEDTDDQEADALLAQKIQSIQAAEKAKTVVVRTPGIMGGAPCFRGTRVLVEVLFENLAAGDRLEDILDAYPTLTLADLRVAILQAGEMIAAAAPVVEADGP